MWYVYRWKDGHIEILDTDVNNMDNPDYPFNRDIVWYAVFTTTELIEWLYHNH